MKKFCSSFIQRLLGCSRADKLTGLAILGITLHFFSLSAAGQLKVTALIKSKQILKSSPDIVYTPYSTTVPEKNLKLNQELVTGDELSCPSGSVMLELKSSAGNATFEITGQFRVKITTPVKIYLSNGRGDVRANVPTEVSTGEIVMGNQSTEYVLRIDQTEKGAHYEYFVYEGNVTVSPVIRGSAALFNSSAKPNDSVTFEGSKLSTGDKVALAPGTVPVKSRVTKEDISAGADIYAQVDAGKASLPRLGNSRVVLEDLRVEGAPTFDEAYAVFYKQHFSVLSEPGNANARLQLGVTQINFRLPIDAIYQLKKAEQFSSPDDKHFQALIAMVSGAAFLQIRNKESADAAFSKASKLDPGVFDEQTQTQYGLSKGVQAAVKARRVDRGGGL